LDVQVGAEHRNFGLASFRDRAVLNPARGFRVVSTHEAEKAEISEAPNINVIVGLLDGMGVHRFVASACSRGTVGSGVIFILAVVATVLFSFEFSEGTKN
jgi:hypothetical protein